MFRRMALWSNSLTSLSRDSCLSRIFRTGNIDSIHPNRYSPPAMGNAASGSEIRLTVQVARVDKLMRRAYFFPVLRRKEARAEDSDESTVLSGKAETR